MSSCSPWAYLLARSKRSSASSISSSLGFFTKNHQYQINPTAATKIKIYAISRMILVFDEVTILVGSRVGNGVDVGLNVGGKDGCEVTTKTNTNPRHSFRPIRNQTKDRCLGQYFVFESFDGNSGARKDLHWVGIHVGLAAMDVVGHCDGSTGSSERVGTRVGL
jgi:hypothetical protein